MCGIFGVVGDKAHNRELLKKANDTILHRGPDAEGLWQDAQQSIAFCHRRLAIMDLSEAGAQPMHSPSGRYVLTYNGEVYNFADLKKQLQHNQWRGHSDTEILLACFEEWGIEKTLERIEGQYAMALWDRKQKEMLLVRDRLGEKPLYYGYLKNNFVFASELKPILSLFGKSLPLQPSAVESFFRFGCIPGEQSIFQGIAKLLPGHFLLLSEEALKGRSELPRTKKYWSLSAIALGKLELSPEEAIKEVESTLKKSISEQSIADVPLGAFLSGGIDSSLVVALMQAQTATKLKSFCIGFESASHNEASYARAVAKHLGTDHQELVVSEADLLAQIPKLAGIYDEPFADSSQIPTILVSRMARQQVTVAVSGDGGDELFAGYNRHLFAEQAWPRMQKIPRLLRQGLGKSFGGMGGIAPGLWQKFFHEIGRVIPLGASLPHEKLAKIAEVFGASSLADLYQRIATHRWPSSILKSTDSSLRQNNSLPFNVQSFSDREGSVIKQVQSALEMTLADAQWYLPDDVLVKVDRAAMSQSLETRAPFLSRRMVELAFGLPMRYKIHQGQSKWILRQILYKYVPAQLIERPKMGFGVPLDTWLRHELKDWAWSLLDPVILRNNQDWLDEKVIFEKWDQHQKGIRNWHTELWDVLMFLGWRQEHGC